jgi:Coenzyme PQQ synthesis protein D (PqqD)
VPHIGPDTRVAAAAQRQLSTTLAGEVVILDVDKGVYFGLADVGTLIWSLLQTPRRVSEIVDRIVGEYDVPREVAEADVRALLADLADRDLIEIDDSPDS